MCRSATGASDRDGTADGPLRVGPVGESSLVTVVMRRTVIHRVPRRFTSSCMCRPALAGGPVGCPSTYTPASPRFVRCIPGTGIPVTYDVGTASPPPSPGGSRGSEQV